MKKIYLLFCLAFSAAISSAQTNNYFGATGTLSGNVWNINPAGPYTNALVTAGGAIINFGNAATPTGATITVVGINATANTTWTAGGTLATGGTVAPIDVASGITMNMGGQNLSTAAGTGFRKNGGGTLVSANGNAYPGGFTMNAGTMLLGGVNAMGGAAGNSLTWNGGIISSSAGARNLNNKFPAGIIIGGDVQIGEDPTVNGLAGTGALTFTNNVSLGAVNRTITIGNIGNHIFSGIISNTSGGLTIAANVNGVNGSIIISGANTYSGATTISGGTLTTGASNTIPLGATMTLGGGTLRTGASTGFSQSTGTLNLTANSNIILGTGGHNLNFANSSAVSWTAGQMITITGWTGGYNGTAGTAGRIFVGTDATGLTAGQLAQIQFNNGASNFPASILPTGEVVAGVAGGTPDILLSSPNPAVAAGNILQGSTSATNNPIYHFDLAVTTSPATLTGVTITTAGTYAASDVSNFRCWYSADAVFSPGTDILLSTKTTSLGAGVQVFPSFSSQLIADGTTGYIFITANIPCTAVVGNTISVDAITTADITFADGNKTGTAFAGDPQTIAVATPNNVNTPAASVGNASSSLSWANPSGCYDEILIVARAATANDGTPTGDGTAYTGNAIYGAGTALGSGFVVYKGTVSPQTVTGLSNGTPYFYKFFTRLGTTWSSGVEVSATPVLATTAIDYFRSVASGSWATLATWESSSDSSTWIPATLVPGATAAHVVIQGSDSVWLDANRITANLTLLSNAKMNALTFTITVAARFNLLNTSAFYQGGTVTSVPGSGVQQVLATTSNFHFNGTQAGTSSIAYPAFGNLYWEPTPAAAGTFQNSIATAPFNLGLVVRGNMTLNIQGGTPREIRFATGLSITRQHTINGDLNIISANTIAVITNGGLPIYCSVHVGGNINVTAGVLQGTSTSTATDGSASLNLLGNINVSGGTLQTGNSTAGLFSINYVGTGAQSINQTGGTISFTANQKDTINNTGSGLTLNTPVTHNGIIEFIAGVVHTTTPNILTFGTTASVTGASNASYVSGPVRKTGNTAFTFPVGKSNGYVPLRVSNFAGLSAPTDQFTAEYVRASGTALGTITAPLITRVSSCEYWTLSATTGTPTVDLTLYWNANNPCGGTYIDNLPDLEITHFDGTNWDNSSVGFSSKGGTTAAGDITWPGVNTFSPFTLASTTGANPLPITINYFNGAKNNGNHLLNWKVTCISTPSATLEVERSTDGRNYSSIYSIFATAIRCQQPFDHIDNQPAKGVNYYRLKMTDVDGKVSYSTIVSLINGTKGIDVMNIAPNPIVNKNFTVKISAAEKTQVELVITDMQGRVLQKQTANMIGGFNTIPVSVNKLAAGTYHLFGNTTEGRTRVLRFVIQ